MSDEARLPVGIVPIVQTPFDRSGDIDVASFRRLIEHGVQGGAAGLVFPAVASEVAALRPDERRRLVEELLDAVGKRVPVIVGVSDASPERCVEWARHAATCGADGVLVQPAVSGNDPTVSGTDPAASCDDPAVLDDDPLATHLDELSCGGRLYVILQDLDWHGPGMAVERLLALVDRVDALRGIKVETVPAGPKYTALLDATGTALHVSGGWAVQQMIEGLDRRVSAFMPECSMVRIYRAIWDRHRAGMGHAHASAGMAARSVAVPPRPDAARELFDALLPVLAFSNQHIDVSIQFFKRLLVAKGIFATVTTRACTHTFDAFQERVAAELIERVLALESALPNNRESPTQEPPTLVGG